MKSRFLSRKADYIGIVGSVLCMIHCFATPLLLVSSSVFRHTPLRVGFVSLDYVFIGINTLAVYLATRHYAPIAVKRSLWGFLGLFSIALLLESTSSAFHYVAYVASAGLVISHLINIRQHRFNHSH